MGKSAVLIAGPTASGKSRLALERAQAMGGVVVNSDALQVYSGLRVVTARPSDADLALAPHRLYGEVDPAVRFSTGDWARAAQKVIAAAGDAPLIFAGGTGLYFEALTKGFADVPEVPAEAVAWAEERIRGMSREERGRLIAKEDPVIAARLRAPDPQRVTRALAVLKATGRSLATFQDAPQIGLLEGWQLEKIVLNPDRDVLRQRIASRFDSMLQYGAVEEVRGLLSRKLDPTLPALKAIGVSEIAGWLAGEFSREEMVERAVIATRQYAKRQRTWFRARMADWIWIEN